MTHWIPTLLLAATALTTPTQGRWLDRHFTGQGPGLDYRLFLPAGYDGAARLPMLVMLHGCTQSAADFAAGTRLAEAADREGLVLVFPEQRADGHPQRCWNWYDPAHQGRGAGEPAWIDGIVREVLAEHAVDPDRVFLGGISAGGAMSVNLAAAYPERFAAVAVHSGIAFGAARDVASALRVMRQGPAEEEADAGVLRAALGGRAGRIPLLLVQGEADPVVAPRNAEALAAQWAEAGRDPGEPAPVRREERGEAAGGGFTRVLLTGAGDGRTLVEHWSVPGLGHAWSGGAPEGSYTAAEGPDATAGMVRFFLDRPRRGGGSGGV